MTALALPAPTPLADPLPDPLAEPAADLPRLRLVGLPATEPPYDDELEPRLRLVQPGDSPAGGAPAGSGIGRDEDLVVPGRSPSAPLRALVAAGWAADPASHTYGDDLDDHLQRRTATAGLPAPHRFAHALVQRVLEVLAGVRPLAQLQRDLTWEAFQALERSYDGSPRTPGPRPSSGAVRSLHLQVRPEGVAEVCASVERGSRRAAIALRLEGHDGAWRCTDLVGV